MSKESKKNDESVKFGVWFWIIIVFIVWLAFACFLFLAYGESIKPFPGTFGDAFGSLNTLFSGLAFALLIYTAQMQRQDLVDNMAILKQTKKDIVSQTRVFNKQNSNNTFFNMIKLYNEVIDNLESGLATDVGFSKGRKAVKNSWKRFVEQKIKNKPIKEMDIKLNSLYKEFVDTEVWGIEMEQCFTVINNIWPLIKEFEKHERERYIQIFKSLFSSDELNLYIIYSQRNQVKENTFILESLLSGESPEEHIKRSFKKIASNMQGKAPIGFNIS